MISLDELADRRERLLKSLGNAIGVVFAGDAVADLTTPFRPHGHFEYLTGVTDEPGAMLLLDPLNPVAARRTTLFLRPIDPELNQWDGLRDPIGGSLKAQYGIATIQRTPALPRWLLLAAQRSKRCACLHPLAAHTAPVSPDLDLFRRVSERVPGCAIEDRSMAIPELRSRKSAAEVAAIQRAVDATSAGFHAVMRGLRAGITEFDVQTLAERAYVDCGARRTAYRTIAGAGINSTVLHYHANDREIRSGDLLCLDSGASVDGYCADITRTLPADGRFTPRQREVYGVVLAAQKAAIAAARAGRTLMELDAIARRVIDAAGFGDAFIHGIGHHLGIETHDPAPDLPLPVGAVITIEPGVYLPEEAIGIRIEDDVLIGRASATVLSSLIPKEIDEIESVMAGSAAINGATAKAGRSRREAKPARTASRGGSGASSRRR
ncbi:MAG TPA: Xaa-Pro peptidase family protein [Phycisphaerales bacterium]|nr:Xaa-Pro peptidase family protein [Phycisphaerales bacterium]HMP38580.1 Xaa-Pro peptidase family protein [Phycisphaerales bacterium]